MKLEAQFFHCFTTVWDVVTVLYTEPSRAFHVDLMDEIPVPLFHSLSQVDRPKVTPAERVRDGEES